MAKIAQTLWEEPYAMFDTAVLLGEPREQLFVEG